MMQRFIIAVFALLMFAGSGCQKHVKLSKTVTYSDTGEPRENVPTAEIRLITDKYASPETSGLTCNVERSVRKFDFTVERASNSRKKKE